MANRNTTIGLDLPSVSSYREPTYYFEDGNLTVLVDTTLFKVHSSVLGRECAAFRPGSDLLGGTTTQGNTEVIAIFNVKAEQFRNFLLMFYGSPSDQEYRWLLSDTPDASRLTITAFRIYLDVADSAEKLAAPKLQCWAHGQLKKTTKAADPMLSRYPLSPTYQLRAIHYAKRTGDGELLIGVRRLIQLHFAWVSRDSPIRLPAENTLMVDAIRERAVELYKTPSLRLEDPPLFGFVFCYVLGLGPEFGAKVSLLTRNDRVALLSAQAHQSNAVPNATSIPRGRLFSVGPITSNYEKTLRHYLESLNLRFSRAKDFSFLIWFKRRPRQVVNKIAAKGL
ncbi:hypothetical protein FRC07_006357 [Ceratobasidium sp. 392]|nr:hypothetical protein FRC07_006357 [Ceratobasidium sp. 392]